MLGKNGVFCAIKTLDQKYLFDRRSDNERLELLGGGLEYTRGKSVLDELCEEIIEETGLAMQINTQNPFLHFVGFFMQRVPLPREIRTEENPHAFGTVFLFQYNYPGYAEKLRTFLTPSGKPNEPIGFELYDIDQIILAGDEIMDGPKRMVLTAQLWEEAQEFGDHFCQARGWLADPVKFRGQHY